MLKTLTTDIQGLIEIVPSVHRDERGWFMESYRNSGLRQAGIETSFVQDNISFSSKGVLRGLHFQKKPFVQAKLVSVLQGAVVDVVVDIREGSSTFGATFKIVLDAFKRNMLFIPEGFAHGFYALEDTIFQYKCSSEYKAGSESGICWNDPELHIEWGVVSPVLSSKDALLPTLQQLIDRGELVK